MKLSPLSTSVALLLAMMSLGLSGCADHAIDSASAEVGSIEVATPAEAKPASESPAPKVEPAADEALALNNAPEATPPSETNSDTKANPTAIVEPKTDTPAPLVVSEMRVRTPPKSNSRSSSGGPVDITFDTIKFDMKSKEDTFTRALLTPEIMGLNGKKVKLRGYILPGFQQRGLTNFVLMRDNQECCFGPGAWIYDCVIVEMKPDKSTDYTVRPIAVEGTFEVHEYHDPMDPDAPVLAVYRIIGDHAE